MKLSLSIRPAVILSGNLSVNLLLDSRPRLAGGGVGVSLLTSGELSHTSNIICVKQWCTAINLMFADTLVTSLRREQSRSRQEAEVPRSALKNSGFDNSLPVA